MKIKYNNNNKKKKELLNILPFNSAYKSHKFLKKS